jgi:phosphomannomutase
MKISCFKAYDIRGRIPDQLNEDVAYRIGRAFAQFLKPKTVVGGPDLRPTNPAVSGPRINGLYEGGGVVVRNWGFC